MKENIVVAENISKRYRVGLQEKRAETFTGQLIDILKSPYRNFNRLTNLSRFKDIDESVFWALQDINFEVERGEVLGIIGHNGAGKSTLLKILSRITDPTTGQIQIKGRVSALLEVGTGFHPELTGRENVYMNGTILGMTRKEIDQKFDAILDFSGIKTHIDTPVKFYSSGMKVRLGFSVAAHLEPELLIIDEVLAVGDYEFQRKCLGKMEQVAENGRTVIFVSHDMGAIKNLCSRALVMSQGKIVFQGPTHDAVENYVNLLSGNSAFGIIGEGIKRNQYNKGCLEFSAINIKNLKGELITAIGYQEPVVIEVKLSVVQQINDGSLLFSFSSVSKGKVTFSTTLDQKELLKFSVGSYTIQFTIAQNLLPGIYSVDLGFLDKTGYPYDSVEHFGQLEILKSGSQYQYPYYRNIGFIRLPMDALNIMNNN